MFNDPQNVLNLIRPTDRVLDVGGGVEVFPRANAVIDLLPYDSRHPGQLRNADEQFGRDDWHVGDICTPNPWRQFRDQEFDFVICSHVLEDVRDPIFLCSQLQRVGKAGYIEVPSRFRECARSSADARITGWEHHRWIVDVEDGTLIFTQKNPWVHQFDYLGEARRRYIAHFHHQFTAVYWKGSFDYVERTQKGSPVETENLFHFFEHYPYDQPAQMHVIDRVPYRGRTFEWLTEFRLPVELELSAEAIVARHRARVGGAPVAPEQPQGWRGMLQGLLRSRQR